MIDDDDMRPTPPAVTSAVAAGVVPLPFLAVYATIFIVHGTVHPAHPPDITSTKDGELVAGLIVLVFLVLACTAMLWLLNRTRRWPHVLVQLVLLGTAIDFLVDDTVGGRPVSTLLAAAALVSLVCSFAPSAWEQVRRTPPPAVVAFYRRLGVGRTAAPDAATGLATSGSTSAPPVDDVAPAADPLPNSAAPTIVEPAPLRRRRRARTPEA